MSWNYRIIAEETVTNGEKEIYFIVGEVYYRKGEPKMYGTASNIAGSLEDLKFSIDKIQSCFEKPTLWGGDRFPEEYEHTI